VALRREDALVRNAIFQFSEDFSVMHSLRRFWAFFICPWVLEAYAPVGPRGPY
jgi:hypothetical protein